MVIILILLKLLSNLTSKPKGRSGTIKAVITNVGDARNSTDHKF